MAFNNNSSNNPRKKHLQIIYIIIKTLYYKSNNPKKAFELYSILKNESSPSLLKITCENLLHFIEKATLTITIKTIRTKEIIRNLSPNEIIYDLDIAEINEVINNITKNPILYLEDELNEYILSTYNNSSNNLPHYKFLDINSKTDKLLNKEKISVEEAIKITDILNETISLVLNYLFEKTLNVGEEIYRLDTINECLTKYQHLYYRFQNQFRLLNKQEQQEIINYLNSDETLQNRKQYKRTNKKIHTIISPSHFKVITNIKIREKILEYFYLFLKEDEKNVQELAYVIKTLPLKEIKKLYVQIQNILANKNVSIFIYQNLQYNICKALYINNIPENKKTKDNEYQYLKYICQTILEETPLFISLKKPEEKKEEELIDIKLKKESEDLISESKVKIDEMNNIQKAGFIISGKRHRIKKILSKEELNNKDIKTLKKL